MPSIPASQLISVTPSVVAAGGTPLAINAIFLDDATDVPLGTVMSFASLTDVQNFFGPASNQAALAAIYFAGYEGCTVLPSLIYFAQFNTASVAAYLRGGSQAGVALATIKALGASTFTISIDGTSIVSASVDLSGATSFSNAASIIQTALRAGTPSNSHNVTYDAQRQAFVITSSTTGTTSTIAYPTTNALVTGLKLTSATGAVLSQGATAAVPATVMDGLVALTTNWVTFTTTFQPDAGTLAGFAAWVTTQKDYVFVGRDNDTTPTNTNPALTSFGYLTKSDNGVAPVYDVDGTICAFICGAAASVNYNRQNGTIDYSYKGQAGLTPAVTDATVAADLIANGYNFYGDYATSAQQFQFLQPGQISGAWKRIAAYIDQIFLDSQLQLALMVLMSSIGKAPYNNLGYGLIRAALMDPINQALLNGTIQAGVILSSSQAAQLNSAAGVPISDVVSNTGWYLQILDPGPTVRAAQGSPIITLWYTSGGAIRTINIASINVL